MRMPDFHPVLDGSKRFIRFREDLTKMIPRLPNDKVSLNALQSKNHTDFLITYLCWRLRHIGVRSRKVTGLSVLEGDPRYEVLKPNIEAFTKAVEAGADLGPYLSKKAHCEGYVMNANPDKTKSTKRNDNDHLLNVMGLHHFHLGLNQEASGRMARTENVLFAHVSRDVLDTIGLFDHSVFEWTVNDELVPERQRLWSIYEEYQAAQASPGAILMGGYGGLGITLAGTPVVVTLTAMQQIKLIWNIDPKLDDAEYAKEMFAEFAVPKKVRPAWHYDHLDFGLLNEASGDFKCLMRGPN